MVDRKEERDGVDGMIRMKVRIEDAVYSERIEVRPKHAADRTRAKVEDQRLAAGTYPHATLSPLQARDHRTGSHHRDLHGPPFGRKRSAFSFQLIDSGVVLTGRNPISRPDVLWPGGHLAFRVFLMVAALSLLAGG